MHLHTAYRRASNGVGGRLGLPVPAASSGAGAAAAAGRRCGSGLATAAAPVFLTVLRARPPACLAGDLAMLLVEAHLLLATDVECC